MSTIDKLRIEYKEAYGRNPPKKITIDTLNKKLDHVYEMAEKIEGLGYELHEDEKIINIRNFVKTYAKKVGYRIGIALVGSYLDKVVNDLLNENYPHWQMESKINPREDNAKIEAYYVSGYDGHHIDLELPE